MLDKLVTGASSLFAQYKLFVYLGLAVFAITAILGYGHVQYLKGAAECKQSYAEEQAKYQKKVREEERKRAQAAMKQEAKVSKQVNDLKANKQKVEDEARKLAREANRPDSCKLSTDELQYWTEAVRSTE